MLGDRAVRPSTSFWSTNPWERMKAELMISTKVNFAGVTASFRKHGQGPGVVALGCLRLKIDSITDVVSGAQVIVLY